MTMWVRDIARTQVSLKREDIICTGGTPTIAESVAIGIRA
ncbi:hypothetical protein LCGC14_1069320 [marine sediment metagenome]|uniref:Uncharacterized protein n=1 Tax=marine sediment metagenome TaxID=412755 RepID=A0A0F9MIR6_9ZZZZ